MVDYNVLNDKISGNFEQKIFLQFIENMAGGKQIVSGKNLTFRKTMKPYVTIFFAEFIGTLILMFVGCGACIDYSGDPMIPHHLKSLGFGFAVLLSVQIFGHISACHMNPAVSIVSLLLGFINMLQFAVYIMAEFLGAVAGFGLLKLLYPERFTQMGFCMTKVDKEISIIQGFSIELLITSILCLVLCAVWDSRNSTKEDSTPIRFALIITIISVIAGPLTGASMNTARSFGPAVFGSNSDWSDQWIYWIAPNIAPFITVPIYRVLFSAPEYKQGKGQEKSEELP